MSKNMTLTLLLQLPCNVVTDNVKTP